MSVGTPNSLSALIKRVRKIFSCIVVITFLLTNLQIRSYAQEASGVVLPWMPKPGVIVHLSPEFKPAHLVGLTINPNNALQFDFLINKGEVSLSDDQKNNEYRKLVKYFLASLTIPDDDQWVNLSPYEKNRIVNDNFGTTEMGRDLLAQDYILKQITSSLIYPEDELGKKFWDKVYERAYKEYGTTNIPVNTFNKVWIVPDEAVVYESGNTAYVLKNHLKVMLEEDYLSLDKHSGLTSANNIEDTNKAHELASQIIKDIILPELEREVNEGKNFANLRQIYSGMILATWYKKALKESLLGKVYADKDKVKGVDQKDTQANQAIYQQYIKAFKKGVFNYIKEDVDKYTKEALPRKYFSGGLKNDFAQVVRYVRSGQELPTGINPALVSDSAIDRTVILLTSPSDERNLVVPVSGEDIKEQMDRAMVGVSDKDKGIVDHQLPATVRLFLDSRITMDQVIYSDLLERARVRNEITKGLELKPNAEDVTEMPEFMAVYNALFSPSFIASKVPAFANKEDVIKKYKEAFIQDSNRYLRMIRGFKETRTVLLRHKGDSFVTALPGLFIMFDKAENNQTSFDDILKGVESFVSNVISDNKDGLKTSLLREVKKIYVQTQMKVKALEKTQSTLVDLKKQGLARDVEILRVSTEILKLRDQLEGDLKTNPKVEKVENLPGVKEALAVLFSRDRTIGNILPSIKENAGARTALQESVKADLQNYLDLVLGFPQTRAILVSDEESWNAAVPVLYGPWSDRLDFSTKRVFEEALKAATVVGSRVNSKFQEAVVKAVREDLVKLKEDSAMRVTPVAPVQLIGEKPKETPEFKKQEKKDEQPESTITQRPADTFERTGLEQAGARDDVGGIDLNAANLNLQIKRDGNGVPLPLDQQDMNKLMQIQGFAPTIIEIKPAAGLPIFSELQQKLKVTS